MNIGEYIKVLRNNKEISARELGTVSDVNASYISRIENGERNPSPAILKKLAPFLGVSYEHLLNIAGYTNPDLTLPDSQELISEGVVVNIIKDLVSKKLITNENDIPEDIMKLLISAIKLEVKVQCENYQDE